MDFLVLGLGNDFCSDDGVGIATAIRLTTEVSHCADVKITNKSGLALMDYLLGYKKVIIIDAIHLADNEPGTVFELTLDDLREVINPSPHYTGLPEIRKLSQEMNVDFPPEIRIFAIEIPDKYEIGETLSQPVAAAIDNVVGRIITLLADWNYNEKLNSIIPDGGVSIKNGS